MPRSSCSFAGPVLLPSNELKEETMKALCWHGKNLMASVAGMPGRYGLILL